MRISYTIFLLLLFAAPVGSQQVYFVPEHPVLSDRLPPEDCLPYYGADEPCRSLIGSFAFLEAATGLGWEAPDGTLTDGASIPRWARIIGEPEYPAFVRAALIHDHYVRRKVRTSPQTHAVFRRILLASGVDAVRANVMYVAVQVWNPWWKLNYSPEVCDTVANCVRNDATVTSIDIAPGGKGFVDLDALVARLEADPSVATDDATEEDLQAIAARIRRENGLGTPAPAGFAQE